MEMVFKEKLVSGVSQKREEGMHYAVWCALEFDTSRRGNEMQIVSDVWEIVC